jgi:hypothetical protein
MKAQMTCFVVFFSVFFLIGFGLLGYGLWNARRSMQAASWPTTPGTITQLSVQEDSGGEGGTTYMVKLLYTYRVDGVLYEGNRLAFGYSGSSNRQAQQEIHRKLNDAKEVSVRYDPSDPAVSCLSFGLHGSIRFILLFSIIWLVFFIGGAVAVWLSSGSDSVLLENLSIQ